MEENTMSQEMMNTQGHADKLIVPFPLNKATEDLCNAIAKLDDTTHTMGKRLDDVLSPELTIGVDPNKKEPTPPTSALTERVTMSARKVGDITEYLRRLIARLEV